MLKGAAKPLAFHKSSLSDSSSEEHKENELISDIPRLSKQPCISDKDIMDMSDVVSQGDSVSSTHSC